MLRKLLSKLTLNRTFKLILNKFNLRIFLPLIFLIFFLGVCSDKPLFLNWKAFGQETNIIEAIVTPNVASLGDTVSIKIRKGEKENKPPKIFFDKTKVPVFVLSDSWYRTFIPLSADFKPGVYTIEIFYKNQLKKIDLTIKTTEFPLQELTLAKETAALKASRIEKALVAKTLSTQSSKKLWDGKFIYPSLGHHSTIYGVKRRINGVINPGYFHKGLDFAASYGSEIKAAANGKVILAGRTSKGFVVNGNCIFLDHGHGVITGYLHLSKILVKEGDFIKKEQIIGKVGSSGIASGPHLHWGMYVLGKTVDPIKWTSMVIE